MLSKRFEHYKNRSYGFPFDRGSPSAGREDCPRAWVKSLKKSFRSPTPESKAAYIRSLGKDVVMVGDGLNDAAALASSQLGVALASGTSVAMEAASVVIPGDRVSAIPELIQLSRTTLRTIKQSLFFAFFYNALAIPLAAFGILERSLWAAFAMGASDITGPFGDRFGSKVNSPDQIKVDATALTTNCLAFEMSANLKQ